MNIVIEARALAMQGGGVKTYTQELLRALVPYQSQADMTVVCAGDEGIVAEGFGYNVVQVPLTQPWQIFTNSWLSKDVQQALVPIKPDVVHYTKAAVPSSSPWPSIVTIHDVIPLFLPQSQQLAARYYWPRALRAAATKATHIMTISEASKRDIIKHLHAPADKITVTPLAVNTSLFTPQSPAQVATALQALQIITPYILCVATRDMRKNISGLLRAFAMIAKDVPHDLIIAGKKALRRDHSEDLLRQLGLQERVKFLEFVPFEHLPALYSGADLFVWPSIYEGWGFPVLEAMACGTPVLVSNGGALPEVVGDAGETVKFSTDDLPDRLSDKLFERALADHMALILHDKHKQALMKQKGLAHVQTFSWARVAAATWEVYKAVAAQP